MLFRDGTFGPVVHLAAQAGVRYSLEIRMPISTPIWRASQCPGRLPSDTPSISSLCVIDLGLWRQHTHCRFPSTDNVDHPISLYAATKKGQRTDGACL